MTPLKQKILYKPNKLAQAARESAPTAGGGATPEATPPAGAPGIASDQLLGPGGELKIRHNGELYSLRKTRFNKLILTK